MLKESNNKDMSNGITIMCGFCGSEFELRELGIIKCPSCYKEMIVELKIHPVHIEED